MSSIVSNGKKFSDVYNIEQGQNDQTLIIVSDIYHDNKDIFNNDLFKKCMKKIFGKDDFERVTDYFHDKPPEKKSTGNNSNFLTPFYEELDVNNPNNNRLLFKKLPKQKQEQEQEQKIDRFFTSDHELKFGKVYMKDTNKYYKSLAFFIDDPTAYEYYLDNGGTQHINERHKKSNIDPNWTPTFNRVAGLIKDPAALSGKDIVDEKFVRDISQIIYSNENSGYKNNNYKLTYYYENDKLFFNIKYDITYDNTPKILEKEKKYYIDLNDRTKKGALKIFRYGDDITEPISFTLSNKENENWFNENGSQIANNYIEEGIERILLKHWGDRDIIRTLENAIKSDDKIPKVTGSNSMILTEDRFVSLFSRYSNVNSFYFHSTASSTKRSGTPTSDSASPSDSNSGSDSDSNLGLGSDLENSKKNLKDTDYASFYTKQIKDEEQMKLHYKTKCTNNIDEFKNNLEQLKRELKNKVDDKIDNTIKLNETLDAKYPTKYYKNISFSSDDTINKCALSLIGNLYQIDQTDNKLNTILKNNFNLTKKYKKHVEHGKKEDAEKIQKFLTKYNSNKNRRYNGYKDYNDYYEKSIKPIIDILNNSRHNYNYKIIKNFCNDIKTNVNNEINNIIHKLDIICKNLLDYIKPTKFHDSSNLELIDKFIIILRNMFQNQTYILNDIFNNILEKIETLKNQKINTLHNGFINYIIEKYVDTMEPHDFIKEYFNKKEENKLLQTFQDNLHINFEIPDLNTPDKYGILDYHISITYKDYEKTTICYSEILENFLDCFNFMNDYEACFQELINELIEHKSNNDIDNMIDFLKNQRNYVNVRIKMKVGTGKAEERVAEEEAAEGADERAAERVAEAKEEAAQRAEPMAVADEREAGETVMAEDEYEDDFEPDDMDHNGGAMHEGMRQHSGSQQQMYYLEGGNPDNKKYKLSCNPNNTLYEESDADTEILLDVIYTIHNIAVFKYYNIFTLLFIKPHNQTTSSNPTIQLVIDYLIENNSDELHKNKKEALFKTYFSNIGQEMAAERERVPEVRDVKAAMAMADSVVGDSVMGDSVMGVDEGAAEAVTRQGQAREAHVRRAREEAVARQGQAREAHVRRARENAAMAAFENKTRKNEMVTTRGRRGWDDDKRNSRDRTRTPTPSPPSSPPSSRPATPLPLEARRTRIYPNGKPMLKGGKKTKKLKIYKTKTNNIKVSNKTKNKKNKKKIILNKTLKKNIRNNSNKKKNLKKRLKKANKKNKNIKRIKNYNKSLKKTKKNKKYIYNISIKRK